MATKAQMFRGKLPGELVRIATKTPNWGTEAEFKLSDAQAINTDLARQKRKGFVAAFFMRYRYGVNVPNGGAQMAYNTKRQRACTYRIAIDQPSVERAWWEGSQPAAKLWQMSQVANLPAARLASFFPELRGEVPPGLATLTGELLSAGMPDDALFAASTWGDMSERAVCLNNGLGAVAQNISDVIPLVPTLARRRPARDVLPLHYFSNTDNPVVFRSSVDDPTASGMYPAWTSIVGGAAGPSIDLFAYVLPYRADRDEPAYGMPYAFRQVPREGPTLKMPAQRNFPFVGLFPKYDDAGLDLGLRYYYAPYSWPSFTSSTALIRWQEKIATEFEDTFPLLMSSGDKNRRALLIDLWNRLFANGWELGEPHDSLAPMLFPVDSARASSLISDRIAGTLTYADLGLGAKGYGALIGPHSFAPVYPYAMSSGVEDGLPGFPSVKTDCEPRIMFEPSDDRPVVLTTEITENPSAFATIIAKDAPASQCGCNGEPGFTMQPDLKNKASNVASIVSDRMPLVGVKGLGQALSMNIPEAPPSKGGKLRR